MTRSPGKEHELGSQRRLRIVHLSRFDTGDGAANAAQRLHRELLRLGHDSRMFVAEIRNETEDPTVISFLPPRGLARRVRRRWRRLRIARSFSLYQHSRPAGYEAFSDDRTPHGADLIAQLPPADVINIHSMYQFVDYRAFLGSAPSRAPVARTLHDMSFFTGGCHISAGCEKYRERCGACPQLGSNDANDLSRQVWLRKRSALERVPPGRLHLVTPSHWLANEGKRSTLAGNLPITVIPNGVDTEVFRPRDKEAARALLDIPQDTRVIMFVAEPITRPAKRFDVLVHALNGLTDLEGLLLVTAGSGRPTVETRIPHLNFGSVRNERVLSWIYNAADAVVLPSMQENFPLTILEAMACGTPVIASAVGGIPEVVKPGSTGLLFPVLDVGALREAVRHLLTEPAERARLAVNCRRTILEEYTLPLQAQRYANLYETLLGMPITPREFTAELAVEHGR